MSRLVPVGDIYIQHPEWTNPRTISGLSEEEIAVLAQEIKHTIGPSGKPGPLNPLLVQRVLLNGEEIALAIDGQRRRLASEEAFGKKHEIDVVDLSADVLDLSDRANCDYLTLTALRVGNHRETMSSYELSCAAETLRNRGTYTLHQIGEAIDKSESWVSKILKARMQASPQLLQDWAKGKITDEQFKDLAKIEPAKQEAQTKKAVEARQRGDKAEARAVAKETAERAKQIARTNKKKARERDSEVELERREPKHEHEKESKAPAPKPAPEFKPPPKAALAQMMDMFEARPPTDPYLKGVRDGVGHALGMIDLEDFGAAWTKYLARVDGTGTPKKTGRTKSKGKKKGKK